MKAIFLTVIVLAAAGAGFGQKPDEPALSQTANGKRVLGYFAAFNSGDEARLKDFFLENLGAEALKRRPVEPRLEFHRQLRNEHRKFEIKRIVSVSETEIKLLVMGQNGDWVTYTFIFEKIAPFKFDGWQIEPVDPPETSEQPKYRTPATTGEFLSTLENYINDEVAADRFSGVVLVAKNDKPVFWKAYGLANVDKKSANLKDTKFNIGSINKSFTQIAIGQLVQKGKISYDDKLGKYLPDYPNKEAAAKVTVRQLVQMTSGIGDIFGEKWRLMPKDKLRRNSDFIPLFADQPLLFEPGTKNQYSNGGYVLLGAIIEKVTGKSYYDYVREHVFKPAGMSQTESFANDQIPANTAEGYTNLLSNAGRVNNLPTRPFRASAAGGGFSNAEDLLKFAVALKTRQLTLPDENGQPSTRKVELGIAGGSPGVNAMLEVSEATGYTIIVLSNYDPSSAERLGLRLADWSRQIKE